MITSQKNFFFPIKYSRVQLVVHTIANVSFSIFELSNSVFVSPLDKYIIGCSSRDDIPDIECSLVSVVDVMSFYGSKMFPSAFFAIITLIYQKFLLYLRPDKFNIHLFLICRSVNFGTYRL